MILNFLLFFFYILVEILVIHIYHLYKNNKIIILKIYIGKEEREKKESKEVSNKVRPEVPRSAGIGSG